MRHLFGVGGILQFAVPTADLAERAEVVALAEQHRKNELSRFLQRLGLRVDHHAVVDRQCAGGHRHTHALDFHNAQAAAAVGCQLLVLTQARDVDASHLGRPQNCRSLGNFDLFIVDRNLYHAFLFILNYTVSSSGLIAHIPVGQVPRRMCASVSVRKCLSMSRIGTAAVWPRPQLDARSIS